MVKNSIMCELMGDNLYIGGIIIILIIIWLVISALSGVFLQSAGVVCSSVYLGYILKSSESLTGHRKNCSKKYRTPAPILTPASPVQSPNQAYMGAIQQDKCYIEDKPAVNPYNYRKTYEEYLREELNSSESNDWWGNHEY